MTETEYAPPTEVPTMEQLLADMKEAAKEHPEYGTCPNCIKAVRVDKYGRLRGHNTPELVRGGSMKATYRCPGSGKDYAEHGDFGETWDLSAGRWVEVNIDVPLLFVAHDEAAAKGVELPAWQVYDIRPTDVMRRGVKALLDGSKWRIDLLFQGATVTAHLIRIDQGDGHLMVWDTQIDEAAYGGITRVIEKVIARLDATDINDRMAARK